MLCEFLLYDVSMINLNFQFDIWKGLKDQKWPDLGHCVLSF